MRAKKLTLKLDEGIIERGKAYARRHNTSLSRLFAEAIESRVRSEAEIYDPIVVVEVDDFIRSLSTYVPEVQGRSDKELRAEYTERLSK